MRKVFSETLTNYYNKNEAVSEIMYLFVFLQYIRLKNSVSLRYLIKQLILIAGS